MKIDEYYQNVARISLNSSIASLIPAIMIIGGNLTFFQSKRIMILTIPFLIYSIISFQTYLFRTKQSIFISRNLRYSKSTYQTIFDSRYLLLLYLNTQYPRLMLYYPDGHLAAIIKKYREKEMSRFRFSKTYALYHPNEQLICIYKVKGKRQLKIEVYDQDNEFIGCFEKTKYTHSKKEKKELLDTEGRFVCAVEGASYYMDEKVVNSQSQEEGRLRRGWMPIEWSRQFPEPNTPVLSLRKNLSKKDKMLRLSFLIYEVFLLR